MKLKYYLPNKEWLEGLPDSGIFHYAHALMVKDKKVYQYTKGNWLYVGVLNSGELADAIAQRYHKVTEEELFMEML